MKNLTLLIAAFIMAGNVNASAIISSSAPIYLGDGIIPAATNSLPNQIPPKPGELKIKLYPTLPSAKFNITCDIENPNYTSPNPVIIKAFYGSINGVTSPSYQYLLNHKISKYATSRTGGGSSDQQTYLEFYNYDNTDSVYVKNCVATYAII